MADPIEVNYTPDGDDWTVAVTGRGRTLTGRAVGLIAARDRADQLVEKLTPDEGRKTVVHLLNGDAVEFTTAYLTARLSKSAPPIPPAKPTAEKAKKEPEPTPAPAPAPAAVPASKPTPAPRTEAETAAKPSPTPRAAQEPAAKTGT